LSLEHITKNIIEEHQSFAMYVLPHSFRQLLGRLTASKLDEHFFDTLKTLGVKSLIECGANEATASLMANKIGIDALAIEANPETYEKVTPPSNEKFSKLNFGLGDKSGSLKFYMPTENHTAGSATFKPKKGVEYHTSNIPIKRLDELLECTKYVDLSYALWVDVEGMQYEVLLGGSDTLMNRDCKIIKIEVEDKEIFEGQKWLSRDVIYYLDKLEFELVYRDFEYASQYNLLFVKRDAIDIINPELSNALFFQRKPIGIRDCIINLLEEKQLKREVKALVLLLLGKKLGNKLAAIAGSEASKNYNTNV